MYTMTHILYINADYPHSFNKANTIGKRIVKTLSKTYIVRIYNILTDKVGVLSAEHWDLVIVQNSDSLQVPCLAKILSKHPLLFISTTNAINGYIPPLENLFGVINISVSMLSTFGIPIEMQQSLYHPVEKFLNYYSYEESPTICHIAYCPTKYNVEENDLKLLAAVQDTNANLTILGDNYKSLLKVFPDTVRVALKRSWPSEFKKAHLIVASGYDALCAMALCKPCIILGDCGLGGLVTPDNYNDLQDTYFSGRKGGYKGEFVPGELLKNEIRRALSHNYKDETSIIQRNVIKDYNIRNFNKILLKEVERIIVLSSIMKSKELRIQLKPFLSSKFKIQDVDGKKYIMRRSSYLGNIDDEMFYILQQCNGKISIRELIQHNDFKQEDSCVLWENLYELWKNKLILFNL